MRVSATHHQLTPCGFQCVPYAVVIAYRSIRNSIPAGARRLSVALTIIGLGIALSLNMRLATAESFTVDDQTLTIIDESSTEDTTAGDTVQLDGLFMPALGNTEAQDRLMLREVSDSEAFKSEK